MNRSYFHVYDFMFNLDNKLSWDVQCDKLCSNVAGKISVLRRIRQFCRPSTLELIYERTI